MLTCSSYHWMFSSAWISLCYSVKAILRILMEALDHLLLWHTPQLTSTTPLLLTLSLCHWWFHKRSVMFRHMLSSNVDALMTFWWTGVSSSRTNSEDSWASDKDDSTEWPWCISGFFACVDMAWGCPESQCDSCLLPLLSLGTTAACHKAVELWRSQKSHLAKDPWPSVNLTSCLCLYSSY